MSTPETETATTVTFTERGAEKMQEVLAAAGAGPDMEAGLRIDVVSGGCSGFQYRLVLDEPTEADVVFQHRGVPIVVDREHLAYVRGASVDFADDADGQRFRVDNPNVVYGCGCGSSFVLREDAAEHDAPRT